ncbi:MAG: class I SAM-dependent methyltransferase [Candidatus Dormibacteria bacterium]
MAKESDTPSHYFDAEPSTASRPTPVHIQLQDLTFDLVADTNVFSNSRLDPGTRFLLERAPVPVQGDILDLGCGYGAIAVACAMRSPKCIVHAIDINGRARELAKANAKRLSLTNVFVHDDPATVPTPLSAIYSNPPIRIGKHALHELLITWLDRLVPEGHGYIVVSKHLGADSLARFLADSGYSVKRLASHASYRILDIAAASKGTL